MELQQKTFTIRDKTYTMKEMLGEEDLAFQYQFTNPATGAVNIRDLWFKRLSRTVVSPTLSEAELRQLPSWEINSLITHWRLMNEPEPSNFLENSTDTKTT